MKLTTINTGFLKLDGGAMFGIVPKTLWQRLNPPDENNLCTWAMRCLLIETADRKILVDTGIGDKQDEKFRSHFEPHGEDTLLGSLAKLGLEASDISDVFLTHLHFDHVGGAVKRDEAGKLVPTFPNATYWTNETHYQWALHPNAREKASFLKENILPMQESGQLNFINSATSSISEENNTQDFLAETPLDFGTFFADGHTEKQMLPVIQYKGKQLVFMADLLPTAGHLPLPFVMGYDTRPLLTMPEKEKFLNAAADNNYYLFLEHDAHNEIITVKHTEKGVRLDQTYTFDELFN